MQRGGVPVYFAARGPECEGRKTSDAWAEKGKKGKKEEKKRENVGIIESVVSNLYFHGFVVSPMKINIFPSSIPPRNETKFFAISTIFSL